MTDDLSVIRTTEKGTTEHYCRCERLIVGMLGLDGLCRFSLLGLEPDAAVSEYFTWLAMPEHAGGDLGKFLIFCERQALLVETPRTSRPN